MSKCCFVSSSSASSAPACSGWILRYQRIAPFNVANAARCLPALKIGDLKPNILILSGSLKLRKPNH
jgi:hypothetical protein